MYSEEQWEYVGRCVECGASLYCKDGKLKPSGSPAPDHCCYIEENEDG